MPVSTAGLGGLRGPEAAIFPFQLLSNHSNTASPSKTPKARASLLKQPAFMSGDHKYTHPISPQNKGNWARKGREIW